ncbi:MAG: protease inhibitor I9 family protein, partial [Actinomycetota bacterium]
MRTDVPVAQSAPQTIGVAPLNASFVSGASGVTALDDADGKPVPAEFTALTRKMCGTPAVNPRSEASVAVSAVVALLPIAPAAASREVAPGVRSTPDAWSTPGNTSANGKDYIVILTDSASVATKVRKEESLGNDVSNVFSSKVKGFVAELDNADVRRLKQDSQVLVVEPDSTMSVI